MREIVCVGGWVGVGGRGSSGLLQACKAFWALFNFASCTRPSPVVALVPVLVASCSLPRNCCLVFICCRFWSGAACSNCQPGYYGAACQTQCPGGACKPCNSHGACSDVYPRAREFHTYMHILKKGRCYWK